MRTDSILDTIGDTPLVELTELSPEGGATVLVKLEAENPTGSMKDRMALAMIEEAEHEGELSPGQRVVDFTGGSTGSSLALVCSVLGYPLSLVSADCFAEEKLNTMRALGADLEVLETPEGKVHPGLADDMAARVQAIQEETGAYDTHQIANEHQLAGYLPLGEEILADCPEITDFLMSVGTAGCAMGTSQAFRERGEDIHVTVLEPAESPALTKGELGSHGVEGISLLDPPPLLDDALYDEARQVPEADARRTARALAAKEGIFAGTSSGLNVAAALDVAKERPPDAAVVTVAVDSGLKYLRGSLFRGGG